MKKRGSKIGIVILLFVALAISPATGSIFGAGAKSMTINSPVNNDLVTVYFWDCTGKVPVKKVLELTKSEWTNLRDDIREIRTSSDSIEKSFDAQFALFKEKNLISYDVTYESLKSKAMEEFKNKNPRPVRKPLANNVIINAMCAITFELTSGTTVVLGLNTFVNLIGFDIISFHKGTSPDGISTKGIFTQSTAPGDYVGSMFGLLGYWFGTKTGTGVYSDLVVAGFTVGTVWLPTS